MTYQSPEGEEAIGWKTSKNNHVVFPMTQDSMKHHVVICSQLLRLLGMGKGLFIYGASSYPMENEAAYVRLNSHFQNDPSMAKSVLKRQKAVEFITKDLNLSIDIKRYQVEKTSFIEYDHLLLDENIVEC
jgi:hypothetical protein